MAVKDKIHAFCEEFTDFVLYDEKRCSIIINVKKDYFRIIYKTLKQNMYCLKHVSNFKHSEDITCVFIKD